MSDNGIVKGKNKDELIGFIINEGLNLTWSESNSLETLNEMVGGLYDLRKRASEDGVEWAPFDSPDDITRAMSEARAEAVNLARSLEVEVGERDTIFGIQEKIALNLARHHACELELVWDKTETADQIMDRIEAYKNHLAGLHPTLADFLATTFSREEIEAEIAALSGA